MSIFVLDSLTGNLPVHSLLLRANEETIEVQDINGKVVAYIVSAKNEEQLAYAEARLDLNENHTSILSAKRREGGISTQELLDKASQAVRSTNDSE